MSKLLQLKALAELEEELKVVQPEDVENMGWAVEPGVGAYFMGTAPFHIRALALLHYRASMECEALRHKKPETLEELRAIQNEGDRQKRKVQWLGSALSWVIEAEFPPPPRTDRRRMQSVGIDPRGVIYYEMVIVSLNDGEDERPVERKHPLH